MKIPIAYMRDLERQVAKEEITFSRMVELLNEKAAENFPSIDGSTPHVCPVCCGRQYAPMGFYDGNISTAINTELCRTCGGTGIVWEPERKEEKR